MWSIFAFLWDKRDKQHGEERDRFYSEFYKFQDRMEKEFRDFRDRTDNMEKSVAQLTTGFSVQSEKLSSMTEKFADYSRQVRTMIHEHDKQLDYLGKIINVGRK